MELFLEFEEFGKIQYGKIRINDFSVFVGENNSGKTYVMQLAYAILQELCQIRKLNMWFTQQTHKNSISDEEILSYSYYNWLQDMINIYLAENKDKIIKYYFHKNISIKTLRVEFINIEEKFFIRKSLAEQFLNDSIDNEGKLPPSIIITIFKAGTDSSIERPLRGLIVAQSDAYSDLIHSQILSLLVFGTARINSPLFLPASRTGMLLLYKYFFSEKDKSINDPMLEFETSIVDNQENELGLTKPVYDFLQFLLRYTPSEGNTEDNEKIIHFIESNLINGKLIESGSETLYQQKGTNHSTPLYLSSSMVNELTPVMKMLTGKISYAYLLYDEIETCLHPEKQKEMARLLIRMRNTGYKLIVSTHSDTMAAKLNNLLLLSYMDKNVENYDTESILQKLNLQKEDLLDCDTFHVYQFVNYSDGTSIVKELDFNTVPEIGYDFEQFTKSSWNLYEEMKAITGEE